MRALQLLVIALVYIVLVVEGAKIFDPPFWLGALVMLGPFLVWLYAPLFRRGCVKLRDDDRGVPPSLLDMLLEQTPQFRVRAAEKAAEAEARRRRGGN
jgi:hypothetical protein